MQLNHPNSCNVAVRFP